MVWLVCDGYLRFGLHVDDVAVDDHFFDVFVGSGAGGCHSGGFTIFRCVACDYS